MFREHASTGEEASIYLQLGQMPCLGRSGGVAHSPRGQCLTPSDPPGQSVEIVSRPNLSSSFPRGADAKNTTRLPGWLGGCLPPRFCMPH